MELRVESELPNDEGCEFSESMALLSKKFERALKRLNTLEKGNSQTRKFAYRTCNPTKPTQGTIRSNLRNKPIQCRECGGYGNIQVECVNTKKILSFLATLSDGKSKAYKQDEKQVSQPITLAAVTSVLELETNHQEVLEDVDTEVRTL